MSNPAPLYNHCVTMDGKPYVFTTEAAANDTCKLCAICYTEQLCKEKPLSHRAVIKFESDEVTDPADRYVDEARYVADFSDVSRTATVSKVERVRDGMLRNGYTTTTPLATFAVLAVPRFISPLKTSEYFETRAKQLADDKAAASIAKMLAAAEAEAAKTAAAAAPVATGLPAVPATAPVAAVVAPAAPLPPTPTFNDVIGNFTQ
jgi:hypothetical protein